MENIKKIGEVELVLLVQSGNDDAFEELYKRYERFVYFVAYKTCQNNADAQDVAQETFIEIKRSIQNLQKPTYFRLWVYRIVNSKCKKLFRKNKFALADIEKDSVQFAFLEERRDFVPSKDIHYQSDADILQSFIDQLPDSQRIAIMLFYMEQMTSAEIAEIYEVSEGTIKSRLFTARNTLKKKIAEYEETEGITLNFHDVSSALSASLASPIAIASKAALNFNKSSIHNSFRSFFHANTFIVKAALIACTSTAALGGAYVAYQSSKSENTEMKKNQYQVSFPAVEYHGETISNAKDAYYTLKMKYSKQDISNPDIVKDAEFEKLYQALKHEDGIYYKRLQETGWKFDIN